MLARDAAAPSEASARGSSKGSELSDERSGAERAVAGAVADDVGSKGCASGARANFRLTLALCIIAALADILLLTIIIPLLPVYLTTLGVSTALVGVLFASKAIVQMAFNVPVGYLVDRIGPRTPLLVGLGINAASAVGYAFSLTYGELLACRAVSGIASAAVQTGALSLVSKLAPSEAVRERSINLVLVGIAFGASIGPPVSSALLSAGGQLAPFLFVVALSVALLAVGAAVMGNVDPRLSRSAHRPRRSARDIRSVMFDPYIVLIVLCAFCANASIAALEPTVPLLLNARFGITSVTAGYIFLACPGGYLVVMPILSALSGRFRRWKTLAAGLLGFAIVLPILEWAESIAVVIVLLVLDGIFMALISGSVMPILSELAHKRHPDLVGVAFGLVDFMVNAGFVVAPLIATALYPHCNVICSYGIFAGMQLILFPLSFVFFCLDRRTARARGVTSLLSKSVQLGTALLDPSQEATELAPLDADSSMASSV